MAIARVSIGEISDTVRYALDAPADAGGSGDLGGGDVQTAALLGEAAGDVADDGDLESVQDPDGAEADHDHRNGGGHGACLRSPRHLSGSGVRAW
ncbi:MULTISPECIES: hypothetical protein [unclassified Streptomyces]|uniref:hypothetical protein n=1 Tax=Streptomyces sp. NPDC127129 TaxID=3345373 RepID=UPI003627A8A8